MCVYMYVGTYQCVYICRYVRMHVSIYVLMNAYKYVCVMYYERPPIWRVATNILNKQSRTADKGWSSSFGVGRGANNASPSKKPC
jgi:hypothetical protein